MDVTFALWMFPALLACLFLGFPVAFSLIGITLVWGVATFGDSVVAMMLAKVDDVASNYVIAAVPLFIFMGSLLERSGVAAKLFGAIHLWVRRLPGGLAIGTILLCVVFAASTGIVGATETVVGLLAIPVMMKAGYNKALISGTICAGGSLGTIIPPSVVVIILGPVADVSIGDLFAGMIIPGLCLAGCYILYVMFRCIIKPEDGPRVLEEDNLPLAQKLYMTVTALVPPLLLIAIVLGSILGGLATPTEAAGCGAVASMILCAAYKNLTIEVVKEALYKTVVITAMILLILMTGNMFAGVFSAAGGMVGVQQLLAAFELTSWETMFILLFIAFIAGFMLDLISLMLIVVPIAMPIIVAQQFTDLTTGEMLARGDIKVWFSICFLIMIQTSYLTPPMAPAIFYLRGISPPEITLMHMYKGVIPFILLHGVVLAGVLMVPQMALWLPSILFRGF